MTCDSCGPIDAEEEDLGHGIRRWWCPKCNNMIAAIYAPYIPVALIDKWKKEENDA